MTDGPVLTECDAVSVGVMDAELSRRPHGTASP
jgi:hypothetical protein